MAETVPLNHQLMDAFYRAPAPTYGVVDGSFFGDLPQQIVSASLESRPLFLDAGSPRASAAGPHMVPLPTPEAASRFLVFLDSGKARAVYWAWTGDADGLHRHLRTINKVLIPASGQHREDTAQDFVLFRHSDPNVIATILPLLAPNQLARLLGDAAGLLLASERLAGVHAFMRPADLPPKPGGFLRLTPPQMLALREDKLAQSRWKIVAYLRQTVPDDTAALSDADLLARVVAYEAEGARLGLDSERAHAKWAYLMMTTKGHVNSMVPLRKAIANNPKETPDRMLDKIMDEMVLAAGAGGTA